jgi:hypothetical protein
MSDVDASVEKLETFCRLLTHVNEDLRADTAAVEDRSAALGRDTESLEDGLEGLEGDLADADSRIRDGREESVDALESAADAARGGGAQLAAEEEELDEAEATFAAREDAARAAIGRAGADLEEGHEPLEAAIEEVASGLDASDGRIAAAFADLSTTLDAVSDDVLAAAEHARVAIGDETSRVDAATDAIVHDGAATVAAIDAQLEPFRVVDEAAGGEVRDAYATLGSWSSEAADGFLAFMTSSCQVWAGVVEGGVLAPLSSVGDAASEDLMQYATTILDCATRLMEEGIDMSGEVLPMVYELGEALQVVPVVDAVLAALD